MTMTFEPTNNVTPADNVPGAKQGEWTYSHYAALPNHGQRYEIIAGVLYMAPPSPTGWHQMAVGLLYYHLMTHVKFGGLGEVYVAPFDVELTPTTVVQPDVLVLLHEHREKWTPSRIVGAPDLVVEVISPRTAGYDRGEKYHAYARSGVKEYWIVDPGEKTIEVFFLEADTYYAEGIFRGEERLRSQVIPNFPVQVQQLF